jgi:hypothetical protein
LGLEAIAEMQVGIEEDLDNGRPHHRRGVNGQTPR